MTNLTRLPLPPRRTRLPQLFPPTGCGVSEAAPSSGRDRRPLLRHHLFCRSYIDHPLFWCWPERNGEKRRGDKGDIARYRPRRFERYPLPSSCFFAFFGLIPPFLSWQRDDGFLSLASFPSFSFFESLVHGKVGTVGREAMLSFNAVDSIVPRFPHVGGGGGE